MTYQYNNSVQPKQDMVKSIKKWIRTYKKDDTNTHKFLLFDSCQTHVRQLSDIWPTRVRRLPDSCQTTKNFKHFKPDTDSFRAMNTNVYDFYENPDRYSGNQSSGCLRKWFPRHPEVKYMSLWKMWKWNYTSFTA